MHSSNLKWFIVIILLMLILGSLIFLSIGRSFFTKGVNNNNQSLLKSVSYDFSIFDAVSASLTGKITKIEGDKIFFENQKGVKGGAMLSDSLSISDLSDNQATPSGDLKRIQLNKNANMVFSVEGGKYYVQTIIFTQP